MQKYQATLELERERLPMRIPNNTLGKNIAHYRKELKLSQAELAAIVSMQHNHLSCIEAGLKHPRINMIARLAVGLGVSIEELINGK